MKQKVKRIKFSTVMLYLFMILLTIAFLYPLALVISISITSETDVIKNGFSLLPKEIDWSAYKLLWAQPKKLVRAYGVTIAYSILATVGAMFVQSAMGYAMSKNYYVLKGFTTKMLLITMLFGGTMVSSYILTTRYLHLGNSFWIYVIPSLYSTWSVILYKTFFKSIPEELYESARMDGANEYVMYLRITLPLSTPILATNAFGTFVSKWNEWSSTMIYIRNPDLYSLQYYLQRILKEQEELKALEESGVAILGELSIAPETMRYAVAVLASLPVLFVFPMIQRYFEKGMVVGSVKG